jgi:putative ABC transport system permease protein
MATGHLLQDLRYAIRLWAKRPGFTAIAIVVLGFGIASTTTVFSLVNAVLLHSPPFAQVDRLLLLWQQDRSSGRDRITLSPAEYVDYSTQSQSFESIGAVRGVSLTAGIGDTPTAVDALGSSIPLLRFAASDRRIA